MTRQWTAQDMAEGLSVGSAWKQRVSRFSQMTWQNANDMITHLNCFQILVSTFTKRILILAITQVKVRSGGQVPSIPVAAILTLIISAGKGSYFGFIIDPVGVTVSEHSVNLWPDPDHIFRAQVITNSRDGDTCGSGLGRKHFIYVSSPKDKTEMKLREKPTLLISWAGADWNDRLTLTLHLEWLKPLLALAAWLGLWLDCRIFNKRWCYICDVQGKGLWKLTNRSNAGKKQSERISNSKRGHRLEAVWKG